MRSQASDEAVRKMLSPDATDREYFKSVFTENDILFDEDIKQTVNQLLNNIFLFEESKNPKAIWDLYTRNYADSAKVTELNEIEQPHWINTDATLEMMADCVITQMCLQNYEEISGFLDAVRNPEFDKYYEKFSVLKDKVDRNAMLDVIGLLRIVSNVVTDDHMLNSFIDIVSSKKNVSDYLGAGRDAKSFQLLADVTSFYYDVFKNRSRHAVLSYLFLRDFVESGFQFSVYVLPGCVDVICAPFQNVLSDVRNTLISASVHEVKKWELLHKKPDERHEKETLIKITTSRINNTLKALEEGVMKYMKVSSISNLVRKMPRDLATLYMRHAWGSSFSRLYEMPDQFSPEVAENLVHDFFLNKIYVALMLKRHASENSGMSLPDQKTFFCNIVSNQNVANDYICLFDSLSDYSVAKRMEVWLLSWFYSEVQLNVYAKSDTVAALKKNQDEVKSLNEKLVAANDKIARLSRMSDSAAPRMMNVQDDTRELDFIKSEKERLEEKYNEAMNNVTTQNEYIAILQEQIEALAKRNEELEPVQDAQDDVYLDKVAIVGYLTGNDQQRVKEHLPNAIFISDSARDVPKDMPTIIVICRMKHKLMFKAKSLADKKNLYYYNGVSMQNVYTALKSRE